MKPIVISANTSWYLYNFRRNTITSLLEMGYPVVAISPKDEYSEKLVTLGCKHRHVYIDQGSINPIKDIVTLVHFIVLYLNIRPSITLNFTPKNNIYGNLAAHLVGAKAINNIAGLGKVFVKESLLTKLVRLLYRLSLSGAQQVFFQNNEDLGYFVEHGIIKSKKAKRIPGSGVDLNRFKYTPPQPSETIKFLLIARMLYEKGVGIYVDAARKLKMQHGKAVEFQLLGMLDTNNPGAISKEQMNTWSSEGIINYLGTSDTVEDIIAQVDCVVLPSFYREGVPKTLLEAGAMGKPIITTDHTGCRETVDDGKNGFLCQIKSTQSLTEQLSKFLALSDIDRTKMGEHSREKIASEFDEKIVLNAYIDEIKKIHI